MLLGIDSDETIYDMLSYLCLIYNYRYSKNIKKEDIKEYNLKPLIGKQGTQIFHEIGFFQSLKPYPNAIVVLKELSKKHDILILTHPPNAIGAYDKYESFQKDLPFIPQNNIIMCDKDKKKLINLDLIFDDNPDILNSCRGKCITVKMNQLYNQDVITDYNVDGWLEFRDLINKINIKGI